MELPYEDEFKKSLHYKGHNPQQIQTILYFNQHFLNFIDKEPYTVTKQDVLRYLGHLVENYGAKQATVSFALSALQAYFISFRSIKIPTLTKPTKSYKPIKELPADVLQSITRE